MNDNDRKEFSDKMVEMAKVLGRVIDDEDIAAYFNQLQDLPLNLVTKGIDQAIRDRDPEDEFLKTSFITVPEIRGAIARMLRDSDENGAVAGCEACSGIGWVLSEGKKGQPAARPCKCLYEIAKKVTISEKKPTLKELRSRKSAEETVKAYEYFKEKEEKKNAD